MCKSLVNLGYDAILLIAGPLGSNLLGWFDGKGGFVA